MTPKRRSFLSALFFTCFKLILNKKKRSFTLDLKSGLKYYAVIKYLVVF